MNSRLSYKQYISKLSKEELQSLLKTNERRLLIRTIFLILVAICAVFVMPILAIFPIAVLLITGYWLMQNNNEIKREIEKR